MQVTIDDLIPVFRDVLENDKLVILEATTADDIEEWDSLNHVYLVVAIEKKFGVKFTTQEIQGWKCVGDILIDMSKK